MVLEVLMTCQSDADTVLVDLSRWSRPVSTRRDLDPSARVGQLCFVIDEDRTFERRSHGWEPAAL